MEAVEGAFGAAIDYAMLVKVYSNSGEAETRYSPGEIVAIWVYDTAILG